MNKDNSSLNEASRQITERMQAVRMPQLAIDTFLHHYAKLRAGARMEIPESDIRPVTDLPSSLDLGRHEPAGRSLMGKTVIIKLNGGLGTSMGLDKAKSLLPVKNGMSFLDIIACQVSALRRKLGFSIPLVLMNSFSTEEDSLAALHKHKEFISGSPDIPLSFLQHQVPKISKATGLPVTFPADPEMEWCPPGHGDIYTALVTSGVLENLLSRGIEYAFVSNADNLGATLDFSILGYFASGGSPFMMEVTERTAADRKGGHLAQGRSGLLLREIAQCPAAELDAFQNIAVHRYFNTNNLWINLRRLDAALRASQGILDLPLIINQKTVDPCDKNSEAVYQLETAMGSAISAFDGAAAVCVPRTRFAPVKTTNDLLALWSDIYDLTQEYHVVVSPRRTLGTIDISLDPSHYKLMKDFDERFRCGAPSLIDCESLTITGDIYFEDHIRLQGRLLLKNRGRKGVCIPAGTTICGR